MLRPPRQRRSTCRRAFLSSLGTEALRPRGWRTLPPAFVELPESAKLCKMLLLDCTLDEADTIRLFPNSVVRSRTDRRVYVSDEIDQCRDLSGIAYRRPFERVGYLDHRG